MLACCAFLTGAPHLTPQNYIIIRFKRPTFFTPSVKLAKIKRHGNERPFRDSNYRPHLSAFFLCVGEFEMIHEQFIDQFERGLHR